MAIASLTIATHAQLKPKPSRGWWSYSIYGSDHLVIGYEWWIEQGDWLYIGSINRYGKGYVTASLPDNRIQNALWLWPGCGANGVFRHEDTTLGPVPGQYFYR
jgi:hypothetical protein